MSRAQRLTFLAIAVVIAVVAVVILASADDEEQEAGTGAQATATATATPDETATPGAEATPDDKATPEPTRAPPPVLTQGEVTKLRFTEGDVVRFRVRVDTTDHVHVHGYDLMKDVSPGKTVTMSFPASITGIFEIELEDAGEQIGQLRVDPD